MINFITRKDNFHLKLSNKMSFSSQPIISKHRLHLISCPLSVSIPYIYSIFGNRPLLNSTPIYMIFVHSHVIIKKNILTTR